MTRQKIASSTILLLALVLISLNLRPALTSIAPVMEQIVSELNLSRATAGLVTTIPVLLMGLLAPLAPMLASKWTQERVLAGAMACLAVSLAIRAFSHYGFAWLLLSAVGAGVAIALAGPLLSGFIKQHFAYRMGSTLAIYSVSLTVGASLAVGLSIPLTSIMGGHWDWGLASWGILAFVTFVVLCVFLPKSAQKPKQSAQHESLPWHSRRAWLLTAFFAAQSGVFYTLATWLVAHFEQSGLTVIQASFYVSLFMSFGIIGAFILPLLASKLNNRRWLIAAVTCSSTMMILSVAWQPTQFTWLVVSLLGASTAGTFSLALSLPVLESDTPAKASSLSSMMSSFGYIIGGTTPSLIGMARDMTHSFELPLTLLAGLSATMIVIALVLPGPPPRNES